MKYSALLLIILTFSASAAASHASHVRYIRQGSSHDIQTRAEAGIAMMGGGDDLDEAFRWLCAKGNGGDFLILRAHGDADYNPYVSGLCHMNSVATLIIADRKAALEPRAAEIIAQAEVVFIAGGDQSRYVNFWKGTPVQDAINAHLAAGKPIGGTSAGLAVLGEFVYACLKDKPDDKDLASTDVLPNPYFDRVTLVKNFLKIPHLENLITDSHFAKRDRLGRSLGFLARIMQDGWSNSPREIAIDEKSAVLVEGDGKAKVVGTGEGAYFLRPTRPPELCKKDEPLTFRNIEVIRVQSGGTFDLYKWTSDAGTSYTLSVVAGKIESTQPNHSIY